MDVGMIAIAERLVDEFGEIPTSRVVRVVTDCVDEYPSDGSLFIEQAARARLSAYRLRDTD
jgi:hypothetical protein